VAEYADMPALIPARMLNEFSYCPRLFYLEWVDDRWADNSDTAEGDLAHRRVDVPTSDLPSPEDAEFLGRATSVRLSSQELGVVAVIDRIDMRDGQSVPVDIKKGAPARDGTPWPADRVQILVHAMLLLEAGYRVDHAEIYYASIRRRVSIPVTRDALDEARELISRARAAAGEALPPPPLVDSPKCPRCSLVGLCLPDETNAMLARSELPPRRIVPRDPDHRPLYVAEQGVYVGIRGGRVRLTKDGELLSDARLIDVSQLCLFGNVQVSAQALGEFWSRGIPVLWFSYGGWLRGWATGEPSKYVELRRRQVAIHAQGGHAIARALITGKIKNSRTLLRRNARTDVTGAVAKLAQLAVQAEGCTRYDELLGIEGTAARLYFGDFTTMITTAQYPLVASFDLNGRSRRPPPDVLNCLLSFCYSLLVKDLVAVCLGVGLDPFLGVLHRPRFGRPALALDLAEEFRPLIAESTVINLLNNGEVQDRHFVRRTGGVTLTTDGQRKIIRAYERRLDATIVHPVFKYRVTYRRVLDVQARILAAVIVGELDEYVPMITR
jgi:CRISPR-associated protein Cas1